jgi:hypothetical protein
MALACGGHRTCVRPAYNPDLDNTACSATDCFHVADAMAVVKVKIQRPNGLIDTDTVGLEIALCAAHALLLRASSAAVAQPDDSG